MNRTVAVLLSLAPLACRAPTTGTAPGREPSPRAAASAPSAAAATPTAASAAPVGSARPQIKKGFEVVSAVLYQPDSTLTKRLADVQAMAAYNQAVTQACAAHFAEATRAEPLDVVVALRPGRSRVWFVAPARPAEDADLASLRAKLERLSPPPLKEGPVVFALLASLGGAVREKPVAQAGYQPPLPQEWLDAKAQSPQPLTIPDGLLAKVWP